MNENDIEAPKELSMVCIGASAGGLEALEQFFQACPADLDVAYVVIQHLSTHYKSMMADLINRYTPMNVVMIEPGMHPEANTIYLIEAGTSVRFKNGMFFVEKKEEGKLTLPIDIFLQSVAECELKKVIAVILSGTGSDGSRGAVAINAHGGFVIAQEPDEASFNGMPNSVISTGIVDDIQLAGDIPKTIANYLSAGADGLSDLRTERITTQEKRIAANSSIEEQIKNILLKLKKQFGIDFSRYKEATILRRIERRMQVKHIPQYSEYARFIELDPLEPIALRRELLIPVTNFFRDQEVFEELDKKVIRAIVATANQGTEIRVWVAGCSTGEEAYSILILLFEEIERQRLVCRVKVFATDVNPEIIDTASKGFFADSISNEIPTELLKKYFVKQGDGFYVRPELRQQVVFAVHNLLTDAPFTKMDLVSCRNTLIYLRNEAQSEALQKLQYATKEKGYLLLGKSESLNVNAEYFEVIDRKLKIYRKSQKTPTFTGNLAVKSPPNLLLRGQLGNSIESNQTRRVEILAENQIRKRFLPLSLLVNSEHEVVHIYGDNTDLLRIKPGNMSYQLGNLLPEKLAPAALALLYRIGKESGCVTSDLVEVANSDHSKSVYIRLSGWEIAEKDFSNYFVLSFTFVDRPISEVDSDSLKIDQVQLERIKQLELELTATRESLQSTIEELETTNEELQSTNEELMASNEELQSSNEELQSVNEELNTVNAEYHEKMSILNRINADLDAMSHSTGIATVFVDNELNLTRFTPDATELFKIRDQYLGRPLSEIVNYLDYDHFFDDINMTLITGRPKEIEIAGKNGQHYLLRIMSYKLPSVNQVGAAISLIQAKNFGSSQRILDSLPEHVAVLDRDGNIVLVNNAWNAFSLQNSSVKQKPKLGVGINYFDVCNSDDSANEIVDGIKKILSGSSERFSFKYPCHSPTEKRWFIMEVRPVKHDYYAAVVSHFNVTQWEHE